MEEITLRPRSHGALGQSLGFHLRCRPSDYGCSAGGRRQRVVPGGVSECAGALFLQIETRRPPGVTGHARRVISSLGGARRLGFQRLGEFALRHEYGIRRSPAHRPPVLRGFFLWSAA